MNKIVSYIQESYNELVHKVSWPSWEELQSSTMVVLLSTIIVTLIVWIMDLSASKILEFYYNMFK
ncbi:MAG TPA: preprotein translocase subunit SecE [Chitinophagaceae bacterium]|nr:preprotein translocase subunit SecE [Chitinophagaceae bacterium]